MAEVQSSSLHVGDTEIRNFREARVGLSLGVLGHAAYDLREFTEPPPPPAAGESGKVSVIYTFGPWWAGGPFAAALRRAATSVARSHPGDGPAWVDYFSPAHFAGTALRCYRDLRQYRLALRYGPAALDLPATNTRTRALHTALLATIHADTGDVDTACELGRQALTSAGSVESLRVRQRFAELATRLAPHRRQPNVADLLDRVSITPAAACMRCAGADRPASVQVVSTWTEPATWYARLPAFYAAAAALITDPGGRVLLVKASYRDHWSFPGGYVDEGESPDATCQRELREELGLTVHVGQLVVVDWAPPSGPRPRAIISLTFDCGTLPADTTLCPATDELQGAAFLPPEEAAGLLPTYEVPRVTAALKARHTGRTSYLGSGQSAPAATPRRPA